MRQLSDEEKEIINKGFNVNQTTTSLQLVLTESKVDTILDILYIMCKTHQIKFYDENNNEINFDEFVHNRIQKNVVDIVDRLNKK